MNEKSLKDPEILKEILYRLVGPINPTGSDSVDRERLENLKVLGELIDSVVLDIDNIAYHYENSYEHSIKELVNEANNILDKLGIEE